MEYLQTGALNNDFRTCLSQLMTNGLVANPRGTTTREFLNYNITLMDPRNRIINFKDRKTNLKYLLGEFIWYLKGDDTPKDILPYSKFWANITNGGTEAGYGMGTINSNYGNRIFGHNEMPAFKEYSGSNVSQWNAVANQLIEDKDTRQALMNIHVPSDRHGGNKDVPCTLTLHWFIRENKLCLIVNMRSNDIVLGFTNDVFQFTMLQEAMQVQLKSAYPDLELGTYFHNAGSMHIYDRHFEMAEKIIADEGNLEIAMKPMDAFTDEICLGLIGCEAAWIAAGGPEDFDFTKVDAWKLLTPYWQTSLRMFFTEDDAALHEMFDHA